MINVKINWYQFEFKHTIPGICQYLVENNSDSDSCRKLTLLFVYVYVVIHFGECVIFLSESECGLFCVPGLGLSTPYVVVCFVYQGLDCQRLMSWFVKALTIQALVHKTNHDIRR
jgi:hypothetical protein